MKLYSRQDLQLAYFLLWGPSVRLSAKLDNERDLNLKLPINFILYVIILLFSCYFLLV